jgi:copper transport protein
VLPLLNLVTGWLLFLSLSAVGGVVIGRWTVLSGHGQQPHTHLEELRIAAARLGRRAALLLSLALGLVFLRQLLEFRDPFVPWTEDAGLLLGSTTWGAVWLLGVAVTLVLLGSLWLVERGRSGAWWPITVMGLALGAFPALTGHANAGDLRALALVADTLHVWAVGGWIGGLGLVLFLDHRQRRIVGSDAPSVLPTLVTRFSPVAMASVATLVVTGLFASWVRLDGVGALVSTDYGRLLLVKVILAGAVLGLGARNFKRLTPKLGDAAGRAAMRKSAVLEFLVANVVLVVTAILVRTSTM